MEIPENILGLPDLEMFPENQSEATSDRKNLSENNLETLLGGKLFLEDLLGNTTDRKPYLYKTVEDLIEVKSTQFWRNRNVRVLGRFCLEKIDCDIKATLTSPLASHKNHRINLNMDLMNYDYPQGKLIEVFGYFDADPLQGPEVKVVNIVQAYGVNVCSYYKAIKLRDKHVPEYNDENDEVSFTCE